MRKAAVLALCPFLGVLLAGALAAPAGFARDRTLFPHARHTDLACEACHPNAAESEDLTHPIGYEEGPCGDCHHPEKLADWGYPAAPKPARIAAFSHGDHLTMGKSCPDCHGALVDLKEIGTGKGEPGHPVCFECHDNITKDNDCDFCHTGYREGRLSGLDRDRSAFKPIDHHPGFVHDHSFQVRLDGAGCADCHRQQDFCSTCHQGANVEFLVHPRNWLGDHPVAARKNMPDCSACHDRSTYCTECHMAEGIRPESHGDQGTAARLTWRGREHAIQARRDVGLCAGCHDADNLFVCSSCHVAPGGKSPHGPDFRSSAGEGYWHDECRTRTGACYDCHGSDPLFCGRCHETRSCE